MAIKISLLVALLAILSDFHAAQSEHAKHGGFEFIGNLRGCHKGQNISGLHHLKRYLEKFGYSSYEDVASLVHRNDDEFDDHLESAVKSYQRNFGLEVTGTLDAQTVKQMMMRRCGNADKVKKSSANPSKNRKLLVHSVSRYAFLPGNPRWRKSHLTYRFRSSAEVNVSGVMRSVCASAFQRWASVSHFTFQEAAEGARADIEIGFHHGDHGDNTRFDGPSGLLAHASPPATLGLLHFDAAESWSTNPGPNEMDLESVTVHEIGHVLGLAHEPNIPGAIMFPAYMPGSIKRELHDDDISGIRALY